MKASRETRSAYGIGLENWTISSNNLSLYNKEETVHCKGNIRGNKKESSG